MSEIGCNNKKLQKGFTLIEILVVLIIIGISTTLITLNFSTLKSIDSQGNSFEKTVNFLTEESIVTGNIIGWYLNSNKQFAEYINDNKNNEIDYDFDNSITYSDLWDLVENWEISNMDYEIGPVVGEVPHVIPSLDSKFDIEDGMAFVQMWSWYQKEYGEIIEDSIQVGRPLIMNQNNEEYTISSAALSMSICL
mgnify:CR=1 FL=1